ncbi:MAG TPA: hypothetical protein VGS41_04200, partial [Chthonomonadales bacterium]|nr:hypothetical protein [Chthonomonadales bacterium]
CVRVTCIPSLLLFDGPDYKPRHEQLIMAQSAQAAAPPLCGSASPPVELIQEASDRDREIIEA